MKTKSRFVSVWFCYLLTDWITLHKPELKGLPVAAGTPDHGRMMITDVNAMAASQGIRAGMTAADAKAIVPSLEVVNGVQGKELQLLKALGEWFIRYTPIVATDPPDGLILDASGCTHLWGGEKAYLEDIVSRLLSKGYYVRTAMTDTIGAAWAFARYGQVNQIIDPEGQAEAILPLPPSALRLDWAVTERLQKLGLRTVKSFAGIPRSALRRRFGKDLLLRLGQALGIEEEFILPLQPAEPYSERLPCPEPIRTAAGIEIAIQKLLEKLCLRLKQEGKGLRTAILKCYRTDGKITGASIGTSSASCHIQHLCKLFGLKIPGIAPGLGIELFVMDAPKVEDAPPGQESLWMAKHPSGDTSVTELLDRLEGKAGAHVIHRYLPAEHYWPENAVKPASSLNDKPEIEWRTDKPRPVCLLPRPEPVEVSAPVPDYPPMLFIYKGKLHHISRADGPERIEREWWLENGEHRDYYILEDTEGKRYWLFRLGHYSGTQPHQWFIHGFFA